MHTTGVIEKRGYKMQQRCVLAAGRWYRLLEPRQFYYMVAEALNACVVHDLEPPHSFTMHINGYLLHRQRVYLVLHIHQRQLRRMLQYFSARMQQLLTAELLRQMRHGGGGAAQRALHQLEHREMHLFRKLPFANEWLAQLITGHRVALPYYDPRLAWLKDLVHNNPFCSTLDYQGGKGPVVVQKKAL